MISLNPEIIVLIRRCLLYFKQLKAKLPLHRGSLYTEVPFKVITQK